MTIFIGAGKFIYYSHVPKTGGTTIENFFRDNGFKISGKDPGLQGTLNGHRFCSPQHTEAERVKMNYRIEKFDYIFATVRNPIDRLVSEFKYRGGRKEQDINLWIRGVLEQQKRNPFLLDNHIRPQWEFILPGSDVFYQEDGFGEKWVRQLSSAVSVNFVNLPKFFNVTNSTDLVHSLDEKTKRLVWEFYKLDYQFFGYEKPLF